MNQVDGLAALGAPSRPSPAQRIWLRALTHGQRDIASPSATVDACAERGWTVRGRKGWKITADGRAALTKS